MTNLAERLTEVMRVQHLGSAKELADFCEVSEGLVSQWFSGTTKLGPKPLKAFARKTRFSLDWITDGRLPIYREIGSDAQTAASKSHILALHPDDVPPGDVVFVPESRIEFSAGNGRTPVYELIEDQEPATYRLSWFQRERINPDRVRRFRVSGDSMEPMLYARDTILVNTDETTVVDGKLYAIRYGDDLRVKYLFRRLDGTIILRSVNPAYKDEEVSAELAEEHIAVIGRVRDRSGKGGL